MNDIENVRIALNEWLEGLDNRDLERMINTCDPEVVVCNEHQPTTVGVKAVRDKYGPRIETSTFSSEFDVEHIKVYGDLAMLVGHFSVKATSKETGQKGGGEGRLALVYRRHTNGAWKLLLDIDNNDERNAA